MSWVDLAIVYVAVVNSIYLAAALRRDPGLRDRAVTSWLVCLQMVSIDFVAILTLLRHLN